MRYFGAELQGRDTAQRLENGVGVDAEREAAVRNFLVDRIEANGAEPEEIRVQAKGRGVYIADVRLEGSDEARQAIVTDGDLADHMSSPSPTGTARTQDGGGR